MEDTITSQALLRLEIALAKGLVSEFEAAVCLAGCEENVMIKGPDIAEPHPNDVLHPVISKIYEIVRTWPNVTRHKPFLWYVEQAIVRDMPYVRRDLVLPRCIATKNRQKEIIKNHPELGRFLCLEDADKTANKETKDKMLFYANEEAARHYKQSGEIISQRKVVPLVKKRLEVDKKFYSDGYIRNCLSGWSHSQQLKDVK